MAYVSSDASTALVDDPFWVFHASGQRQLRKLVFEALLDVLPRVWEFYGAWYWATIYTGTKMPFILGGGYVDVAPPGYGRVSLTHFQALKRDCTVCPIYRPFPSKRFDDYMYCTVKPDRCLKTISQILMLNWEFPIERLPDSLVALLVAVQEHVTDLGMFTLFVGMMMNAYASLCLSCLHHRLSAPHGDRGLSYSGICGCCGSAATAIMERPPPGGTRNSVVTRVECRRFEKGDRYEKSDAEIVVSTGECSVAAQIGAKFGLERLSRLNSPLRLAKDRDLHSHLHSSGGILSKLSVYTSDIDEKYTNCLIGQMRPPSYCHRELEACEEMCPSDSE